MSRLIFAVFLLLSSLVLPIPAAAIDILALPTVPGRELDAWRYVPISGQPALYPVKRIYRDQPFRLMVIGKAYKTDGEKNVNITYTVKIFAPNGDILSQEKELDLFKGRVTDNSFLLLSRQFLTLTFSESDPFGTYRFEVTARDSIASQQGSTTAEIVLSSSSNRPLFGSKEEFSDWVGNYYRDPDPVRAITALFQYVDPELSAVEKQSPLLTFLSRIVQVNPFLWPQLKALYPKADTAERKKILLIAALSGQLDDLFYSSLQPDLLTFYRHAQSANLLEPTDRPVTANEINTLWAEFMATGSIDPIRKLVGSLRLESTRGAQDKIDTGKVEVTSELKADAALETVYQIALGSLLRNGEQHSVVKQYLGYIYDFENLEPRIKLQLEEILAVLKQRSNEEEARKYLEQKAGEK